MKRKVMIVLLAVFLIGSVSAYAGIYYGYYNNEPYALSCFFTSGSAHAKCRMYTTNSYTNLVTLYGRQQNTSTGTLLYYEDSDTWEVPFYASSGCTIVEAHAVSQFEPGVVVDGN